MIRWRGADRPIELGSLFVLEKDWRRGVRKNKINFNELTSATGVYPSFYP